MNKNPNGESRFNRRIPHFSPTLHTMKRFALLFVLITFASGLRGEDTMDARLSALVQGPQGLLFRISRTAGKYKMGDSVSYFASLPDCNGLSFDTSNNRMLANHGPRGALLSITSYRDSYFTLTPGWPGVWNCKDNTTTGSYGFAVETGGVKYDLRDTKEDFETTLLDNLIPQTVIKPSGKPYQFRLLTFTPIAEKGAVRVGGVIYALEIENRGEKPLDCKVTLPNLKAGKGPYQGWAQSDDNSSCDMAIVGRKFAENLSLSVPAGQTCWVPALFFVPGENAVETVEAHPLDWWLAQTVQYYRSIMGRLETPDEPFLGQFYERQLMQCLQSIAMSPQGRAAGSNWGSVPPTRMIWTKDCYYSYLGVLATDPALAEKLIEWFDAHGVRPPGTHNRSDRQDSSSAGGPSHSISLSVAAPMMAAMLYESTGDTAIFERHPGWKAHWAGILDAIIASRKFDDVWMFPTQFISDGPVKGDFHTGSNICFWKALTGYARLLAEVWHDPQAAGRYGKVAADLKAAILAHNVFDGPSGKFLIEASNHGDNPPRMESDGEESDTTLAALYGFMDVDDPLYLGTMRFAMSPRNIAYRPVLNSISWETGIPSTSPGYNKGVASAVTGEECWGPRGHYTEFRRLTDADGSVWWWSYGMEKQPDPLKPIRAFMGIGKAGWTSGVYTNLYRSRMIGVHYDAAAQLLRFAPMATLGRFTWKAMPMGDRRFDLGFDPAGEASVSNPTVKVLHLEVVLPMGNWGLNGKALSGEDLNHLGTPSTLFKMDLPPGETVEITRMR